MACAYNKPIFFNQKEIVNNVEQSEIPPCGKKVKQKRTASHQGRQL
jgi:hypothetical protein